MSLLCDPVRRQLATVSANMHGLKPPMRAPKGPMRVSGLPARNCARKELRTSATHYMRAAVRWTFDCRPDLESMPESQSSILSLAEKAELFNTNELNHLSLNSLVSGLEIGANQMDANE